MPPYMAVTDEQLVKLSRALISILKKMYLPADKGESNKGEVEKK